jgi:hypothetical protein
MLDWQKPGRHERRMMETLNIIFVGHSKLLEFLFAREKAVLLQEPAFLMESAYGYSSGEQILIRVALDLWNSSGDVKLWHIIECLDDDTYENVLTGLRHLRRIDPDGPEMRWRQPKMAY